MGMPLNESNVTCSSDFHLENFMCFPICEQWRQFSDAETALTVGSVTTAALIGILGSVAVIVASIIRYKNM